MPKTTWKCNRIDGGKEAGVMYSQILAYIETSICNALALLSCLQGIGLSQDICSVGGV
jgi:hypothetical protein